jgi:ribosomal protein S18 acetylase RimI-like enzyme
VVHPKLRGKGIGRKLMLYTLSKLRSLEAASVELTSRPARIAANELYRSLGFSRRKTNVYEYRFNQD